MPSSRASLSSDWRASRYWEDDEEEVEDAEEVDEVEVDVEPFLAEASAPSTVALNFRPGGRRLFIFIRDLRGYPPGVPLRRRASPVAAATAQRISPQLDREREKTEK